MKRPAISKGPFHLDNIHCCWSFITGRGCVVYEGTEENAVKTEELPAVVMVVIAPAELGGRMELVKSGPR